mgnify:FL=1
MEHHRWPQFTLFFIDRFLSFINHQLQRTKLITPNAILKFNTFRANIQLMLSIAFCLKMIVDTLWTNV